MHYCEANIDGTIQLDPDMVRNLCFVLCQDPSTCIQLGAYKL
jgi:hypothetical protein